MSRMQVDWRPENAQLKGVNIPDNWVKISRSGDRRILNQTALSGGRGSGAGVPGGLV